MAYKYLQTKLFTFENEETGYLHVEIRMIDHRMVF